MTENTQSTSLRPASWVNTKERSNMLMLHIMSWISLRLGRTVARSVLHSLLVPSTAAPLELFLLFSPPPLVILQ